MKNLLTRAAKLFVAALMIFTLAPTKIVAEGTSAIAISDKNAAVEVHLYKDDKQSTEISGTTTTISRTDIVHGTLAVVFKSNNQPTADKLSYSYAFPDNIKANDLASTPLMNGSETAGTWNIKDNVLTFTYDSKWIAAGHTSNIKANFHFDFTAVNNTSIDSKSSEIKFAGASAPITIHYDDGHVTGGKTSRVNSDNTITFTINITADKDCSLNLTDTMDSNLAFVDGSFKLDGNTVLNPTIDGQTMTLSKYALKTGEHQITYNATVINPSLDTNNDGNIDNVGNDAKWTWDAVTTPQDAPVYPNIIYNKVTKKAVLNSSDNTITWTVTVNDGDIKADMNGYVFTDTLQTPDDQKYTGTYSIKASDKTVLVAAGKLDENKSSFSYTFPADAGKKTYIITYKTVITTKDTLAIQKNTAEGKPSDGKGTHSADAEVGTYITKEVTDQSQANNTGVVSWKSTAKLEGAGDRFQDSFSWNDHIWFTDGESPVVKYVDSNNSTVTMVDGSDYSITWKSSNGEGANNTKRKEFDITFKNTENVRNAIANNHGEYTVEYTSTCDKTAQEYKNHSQIYSDITHATNDAYASYSLVKSNNIYKNGKVNWDSTKNTWKADWTVTANADGYTCYGKEDLEGKEVTFTDTLPAGISYLAGSASYMLKTSWTDEQNAVGQKEPTITKNADGTTVLTFAIPTDKTKPMTDPEGHVHSYPQVILKYSTLVDEKLAVDETKSYTNTVTGKTDKMDFGSASGNVEVKNTVLGKSGVLNKGTALVDYKITVNEHALDLLPDSDTVTLVDILDYRTYLANGTLKIIDHTGKNITEQCKAKPETVTDAAGHSTSKLTIEIPDSEFVTVTYSTGLSAAVGTTLPNVTNHAELSGITKSGSNTNQSYTVINAAGSTEGTAGSVTIEKADSDVTKKTVLSGAKFELYRVNNLDSLTNTSKEEELKADLAGTVVTAEDGTAKFHDTDLAEDAQTDLKLDTLYYFVEIKAPTGYAIDNKGKTYFMLAGTDTDAYNAVKEKANAILGSTGLSLNSNLQYNVYDTKIETTSVPVKKVWSDNNNQDGKRDAVTFQLYANGEKCGKEVTLDSKNATTEDANVWEYTFKDLPVYANGVAIKYTVQETSGPEGYTADKDNTDLTVTNTHTPEVTKITVNKSWSDSDNTEGFRPNYVVLQLQKTIDGKKPVDVENMYATLTEADSWSHTFEKLPVYEGGKKIIYSVREINTDDHYKATAEGLTVTNSRDVEKIDISGTKTWEDAGNKDARPASITVDLYNGIDAKPIKKQTVKVDENGEWKYSFTGLQKYSAGKEIIYSVNEENVENYSTVINGKDITNTYTPGETSVSVTKAWVDENNTNSTRPDSIEVQLYADGEASGDKVKLTAENAWSYTWSKIDRKHNGKDVLYTVKEVNVPAGYITGDVTGSQSAGYVITNTRTTGNLVIKKSFDGDNITDKDKANLNFEVKGPNYDEVFNYGTAFTDGILKLSNLAAGEYTVTEKNPEIAGYDVTVAATVNNDSEGSTATVVANTTQQIDIKDSYAKLGNLVIKKTFDGDNITDEDKENLKFEIVKPDGTKETVGLDKFTKDKTGAYTYTMDQVADGKYTVHETNPEIKGYDVTVTTIVDGKTSDTATVATKATSTVEIKDSYTKRPTTPITPDTPTPTPSAPTTPTPERPTTPTTTDRPHTPNTGDQTNAGMAAGAFGFSMLIAGLAIFFKKKYSV